MYDDKRNRSAVDRLLKAFQSPAAVIPFVGAGLSLSWTGGDWAGFLTDLADTAVAGGARSKLRTQVGADIKAQHFEEAAERIDRAIGRSRFDEAILNRFGDHALARASGRPAMMLLPKLVKGPVVTTNFDRVLERTFRSQGYAFESVLWGAKAELAADALIEDQHVLLKIHGDVGDAEDRVLTRSEYARHYGPGKPLRLMLTRIFRGRTLLFLGCRLGKDRYLPLLRQTRVKQAAEHFACVAAPEDPAAFNTRQDELQKLDITPIWFPQGRFDLLSGFLGRLQREVIAPAVPSSATSDLTRLTELAKREREAMLTNYKRLSDAESKIKFIIQHGERLAGLGFYEDCLALATEGTQLSMAANDRVRAAEFQYNSYVTLHRSGGPHNESEADKCRARAASILRRAPTSYMHAVLADDAAVVHIENGNYRAAVQSARKAVSVAQRLAVKSVGSRNIVQFRRHLAQALAAKGQRKAAIGKLRSLIPYAKRVRQQQLAPTWLALADVQENAGYLEKARRSRQHAIALLEQEQQWRALATALLNQGVNYYHSGLAHDALRCYLRARSWHQHIGNDLGTLSVLLNLAWLHYEDGYRRAEHDLRAAAFRKSREYFDQALAIARYLRSDWQIADILAQRALVMWQLGHQREAWKNMERASVVFHGYRDDGSLAFVFNNKAVVRTWTGDLLKALEDFDRGIACARSVRSLSRLERLYENKARTLRQLGRIAEARQLEKQRRGVWPRSST